MLQRFFQNFVIKYPKAVLLSVLLIVTFLGYQSLKLEIDASAETLLLEDDKDLQYYREISTKYKTPDILVITFTPQKDLLSDHSLNLLKQLTEDLEQLSVVESTTSILNVPLLQSPTRPIKELVQNIPTLLSPTTDKELAKQEFLKSPIYKNNLVSSDFKTTAIIANLKSDPHYHELLTERNTLRSKLKTQKATQEDARRYRAVSQKFKEYRDTAREANHQNILKIRAIIANYQNDAQLFLGGVNMISDDMINFVKNDINIFGSTVFILLIIVLWIVFREIRWVMVPILISTVAVISTAGVLGMFGWEVTVISSNFVSLQLIITMSMVIHLIVKYRELITLNPEWSQNKLALETVMSMSKPIFFSIITTIAGFGSLVLSNILPVINLGWMMSVSIAVSLMFTFLIFPAIIVHLDKKQPFNFFESNFSLIKILASITETGRTKIFISTAFLILFTFTGASKLIVENSFINYFKPSTEIYQGMKVIDNELGGTTPLDVIINFPSETSETSTPAPLESDETSMLDSFEDEFENSSNQEQYWFTAQKMKKVEAIHDYLDSLKEVGNVQSFATVLKVGRTLNDGEDLDNLKLALLYNELPEKFKEIVLYPYVDIPNDQLRFSMRIIDSQEGLRRDELIQKIDRELKEQFQLNDQTLHLSNMLILYNNMLQSLFDSQILTLGIVVLILFMMFLLLFRDMKIALIAIVTNIVSVGVIFGVMGWTGIPLDMMTITIAAISVGIAVDDTIHYIHRFKIEYAKERNYLKAMHQTHESIGYAMYYTSIAIMIGFSVLMISNFIPTIYFGFLTLLAMFSALSANLLLLPRLMVDCKPLD